MQKITRLLTLLLLITFQSISFGQGSFLSASYLLPSSLTDAERSRMLEVQNSTNTSTSQLINLGDLSSIMDNYGNFTFSLPGQSDVYNARASDVEATSSIDYTWIGEVYNGAGSQEGSMVLTAQNGQINGTIGMIDGNYEITPLRVGLGVLATVVPDPTMLECGQTLVGSDGMAGENIQAGDRDLGCKVRILVMYLPSVLVGNFNVSGMANTAIGQVNQAFLNSAIPDLKAELAGLEQVPSSFTPTTDMDADLATFRNNAAVQARRLAVKADVVILISNSVAYAYAGITYLGPSFSYAYGIVQRNNATATYTFAHELGHMFGCDHQQCAITQTATCTGNSGFNHGYKYTISTIIHLHEEVNRTYSTIMHVLFASAPRQLRYSNPNVSVSGVPTGVTNHNDNAKVINTNGCTVANFMPTPLTAHISGLVKGHPNQYISLTSSVSGGTPPYQYEWRMGSSPLNYNLSLGNASTAGFNITYEMTYIRLKVTSADGQVVYAYHDVLRLEQRPGNGTQPSVDSGKDVQIQSISPNPTNELATIIFDVLSPAKVSMDLVNSLGKTVRKTENGYFDEGKYSLNLDLSHVPAGTYYLKIQTENSSQTKRIVVSN